MERLVARAGCGRHCGKVVEASGSSPTPRRLRAGAADGPQVFGSIRFYSYWLADPRQLSKPAACFPHLGRRSFLMGVLGGPLAFTDRKSSEQRQMRGTHCGLLGKGADGGEDRPRVAGAQGMRFQSLQLGGILPPPSPVPQESVKINIEENRVEEAKEMGVEAGLRGDLTVPSSYLPGRVWSKPPLWGLF